jgi:tubulin polyglutamylase TTLL1/tubulin monoglycylase TTLL3/8
MREITAEPPQPSNIRDRPRTGRAGKNERYGCYEDGVYKLMNRAEGDKLRSVVVEDRMKYCRNGGIRIVENGVFNIHNHLEMNYNLGNKKALFHNLSEYF